MTQFHTTMDADAFMTLQSLMKYNNGIFKSQKQANFILGGKFVDIYTKGAPVKKTEGEDLEEAKRNGWRIFEKDETVAEAYARRMKEAEVFFGVKLEPGQHLIRLEGYMQWADYGHRSTRRVSWVYVLDNDGVVARYKLHFTYPGKGSSYINAAATEVDWKRPAYAEPLNLKSLEEAQAEEKLKQEEAAKDQSFIGEVKQRLIFEGVVESTREVGVGSYGYNNSYMKYMTVVKTTEGHTVIVWKYLDEPGKTVKFKATITDHAIYKGTKQTHVTRVSML